jgi:hypothetical protein
MLHNEFVLNILMLYIRLSQITRIQFIQEYFILKINYLELQINSIICN